MQGKYLEYCKTYFFKCVPWKTINLSLNKKVLWSNVSRKFKLISFPLRLCQMFMYWGVMRKCIGELY